MTGKIVPYVVIGLIQASIILVATRFVFHVPFVGSALAIYLSALLFIAANLTVGITLSSLAQNQLQAMQLTVFYFLPNILLSGLHVPVRRHAGVGAVHRQSAAAHLLQPADSRHLAQGQRLGRPVAVGLADGALHGRSSWASRCAFIGARSTRNTPS